MEKAIYNITITGNNGKPTAKEVTGYIWRINGYIIGLHKTGKKYTATELSTGFSIPLVNDPYNQDKKPTTIDNTLELLCRTMGYYSKQIREVTEKEARYDISEYNPKYEVLHVFNH